MPDHSLPKRPHLDQLRRESKQLRDAARSGDPDALRRLRALGPADSATATLSAAQLAVAREYGFASWPRLKEALDQRRGRPAVPSGLGFDTGIAARDLVHGQIVIISGRVATVGPAPGDGGGVRLAITPLAANHDDETGQREIVVTVAPDAVLRTARQLDSGERLTGGAGIFSIGEDRLEVDGIVSAGRVQPGRLIVAGGTLQAHGPDPDDATQVRLVLADPKEGELVVVCPADIELTTATRREPRGLRFDKVVSAEELERGQIVKLEGHVLQRGPDPNDPGRVQLVLVAALGLSPDDEPDQREIALSCSADMGFATLRPLNIELHPPTRREG